MKEMAFAQVSLRSVHVLQEGQRLEDIEPLALVLTRQTSDVDEYKYAHMIMRPEMALSCAGALSCVYVYGTRAHMPPGFNSSKLTWW
jgi:hypothetical protein